MAFWTYEKITPTIRVIAGPLLSWSCLLLGTIPLLRQQRDRVGGFRKMANFADVQYHLCCRRVGRWVRKKQKNVLTQYKDGSLDRNEF